MTLFSQVKVAKVRRVIHNVDNWIPYCLATVKLIAKPIMCFRRLTVFAFYLRPQLCSLRLSAIRPAAERFGAKQAALKIPLEVGFVDNYRQGEQNRTDIAHIGKSVMIKGELSGSEDLYLDGEVEGSIELHDHNLTIGPNGRVKANINAKEVVVHGKVDGSISGSERVELRKSGVLIGDIVTQRIVIEDGAYFKGGIDIRKDKDKDHALRHEQANASTSTSPSSTLPAEPVSSTRG